jgi:uncharacterized membrane protein (UPF0127 family)
MKKRKFSLFHIALAFMLIVVLILAGLLVFMKPSKKPVSRKPVATDTITEEPKPVFRRDGEVVFKKRENNQEIVTIAVEIMDDEAERALGLMYRDSLPQQSGMLFLFPMEAPMAFWMKNTRFSLDIIYINENKEVVDIAKGTIPYSLEQVPSRLPAQYVVEVPAGFTDKYGIRIGDYLIF